MSVYHTNFSWTSYAEKMKEGFSVLQQKQEFVDMTLCAEGYLIKVHKNIVALVSPYLREMINSTKCQHPVIFLSNISHKVLVHIIEYIYTGESQVPNDLIQSFFKAANELHLSGLMNSDQSFFLKKQENSNQLIGVPTTPSMDHSARKTELNKQNYGIEVEPTDQSCGDSTSNVLDNIDIDLVHNFDEHNNVTECKARGTYNEPSLIAITSSDAINIEKEGDDNATLIKRNISQNIESSEFSIENRTISNVAANICVNKDYKPQQYSVSSRGSLQLILNRFIYYLHHHSNRGYKRRWRCFDYRKNHCKAYIDTVGEEIVERKNQHNHMFHDDKILKKVRQKKVYGSISNIEVMKNINGLSQVIDTNDAD